MNGRRFAASLAQREVLVHDAIEPCPYIPGRRARLPLRLPVASLDPAETDRSFARGDRRHGALVYRPECPDCRACEAIRIPLATYRPSQSQRRAKARGDAVLEVEVGRPELSDERLALYERHKLERALGSPDALPIGPRAYRRFLVDTCVDTYELRYRREGRLVGIAILDRGETAASAVYCCYDPSAAAALRLSLGTYSIMKELELCERWGLAHLYLGLYIGENASMVYKARYRPHERLVRGVWRTFD